MKCERHIWDTDSEEWCWKCEELNTPGYYMVHKKSTDVTEISDTYFNLASDMDPEVEKNKA